MPRLPKPGSDEGVWADLLNSFLRVSHNEDGTVDTKGSGLTSSFPTVVTFSGNLNAPRPEGAAMVFWVGFPEEPKNARDDTDIWYEPGS